MVGRGLYLAVLLAVLAVAALIGRSSADDFPVGDRETMWVQGDKYRIGSFRHMGDIYYARVIHRPSTPSVLPRGEQIDGISYWWNNKKQKLDGYFRRAHTTGLLVLKDGKIVYERYMSGADEHTLFTSWSMAKSFTSTLVGFAIGDGLIQSVDDPISKYVPELKGSGYDGVPIKAVLQMSSGVDFTDDYDSPDSESSRLWDETIGFNRLPVTDFVRKVKRARPAFAEFNYTGLDTLALGWLVTEVTGRSLSDYLSTKLWGPLGMEADGTWNVDSRKMQANEVAFCCINATLRDYGRFGLLMLNDGAWQGRQLLPKGWVHEATHPDRPQVMPGHLHDGWAAGYQYQWWVFPEDPDALHGFEAQGINGQFLYVNPEENLVIVATNAWSHTWDDDLESEIYNIFYAFMTELR